MRREDLLPHLIERWSREKPGSTFLQEVDGRALSFLETHHESLKWASAFRGLGVQPGDRVVALVHPSLEMVSLWIAMGWLRATHVPINTEYQGAMLRYAIGGARSSIVVCAERFLGELLSVIDDLGALRVVVIRDSDAPLPPDRSEVTFIDVRDIVPHEAVAEGTFDGPEVHDLAMMMYTSGTTGASKGVVIPWGAVAHAGRRAGPVEGFSSDDVFYSMLPMFHAGFANWIHGIAAVGGTWVFRERWSTPAFWDDVRRYSCTTTFLLGAMANFLSRADENAADSDNPMRSMVSVPLPERVDRFEKRFGLEVSGMYGSTEMGIPVKTTKDRIDTQSCGRPFPEYDVRVVDDEDYELPIGSVGEIVIRPLEPWINFVGYFGMPEATVQAWRNLWFHTGDLGRRDADGNFYFVDRKKDSIRRRGENISSVEVESHVLDIDAVHECAAIPVPSEWGEDEVKVCVVLKPGRTLSAQALIDSLVQDRMPRFMVPRFVEFCDELPKTPTGKIQKDVLRARSVTDRGWDRVDPGRQLTPASAPERTG